MILRKPYAFFIKYFRLFNLIMAILMGIMIYRTIVIGSFLNHYIDNYAEATANFSLGDYINLYSFMIVLLIIIFTIFMTSVMVVKQKPKKLYIINLILYIGVMVLYAVDYSILHSIYDQILDVRVSKAIRDITFILAGLQIVSFILTLVRASGFDIKQFDFNSDLQKLQIDTKDNEEFEVAVEFDKNKLNRNFRQKIRAIKYTYAEHRFAFNLAGAILVVIIAFLIFTTKFIYVANYKENHSFTASGLNMNVKNSYLVQTNQTGKQITSDDTTLVVVRFEVRQLGNAINQTLNTGIITLRNGDKSYGQTTAYNDSLTDLGTPYGGQEITNDFATYILTFAIPTEEASDDLKLKVNDNVSYVRGEIGAKNIYIDLEPQKFTESRKGENSSVGETLSFSDSVLGDSLFTIKQYSIGNKFPVSYRFCAKSDRCYTSYEYVTPTASGNYAKTLMRIDGSFELDSIINLNSINNIYELLNEFATINYKIGDSWYSHKINSKLVKPKIGKESGITYIEVNKDIENASSIYLTFNIRNYTYQYTLK